jgi:glycerate dehydrogenase
MHQPTIVLTGGNTLNPGDISWDGLRAFGALQVHDRTASADILPRAARSRLMGIAVDNFAAFLAGR